MRVVTPTGRTLTEALRTARRRAGLTARGLADRAETSHPTVLAYEQGRVMPRIDTAMRLLDAAGFVLEITLAPRVDVGDDREAKGKELVDVLLLAAEFPARPAPRLIAPVFGPSPS